MVAENSVMTLGSLFDGSGTCPLAAEMCGIKPVWASEIEPYPIKVTKKNFPEMEHLGDITSINGAKITPVHMITFGSPCQDLSLAGKQRGLIDGKRSNLFFKAIRIIKEMRDATHGKYPRFAVWENVPGAFSANKGRDFLSVLRAFVETAGGKTSDVPEPPAKAGKLKWGGAGIIVGDGYSIAWRVLDAKYWGVPQRRKRIYLVADFGGQRAGEILFKREGLRGNFAQSRETRKETAAGIVGGTDSSRGKVYALQGNGIDRSDTAGCNGKGWRTDACYTLNTVDRPAVVYKNTVYDMTHANDVIRTYENVSPTLQNRMGTGGNQVPIKIDFQDEKYTARRFTPLECCRLQGFPDDWESGVKGSDSARYKMWGNGMALPCVLYVMEGIADAMRGDGE